MDNLKNEVEKIFEQNGIVIEQNGNLSDLDSLKLVSSIVDIEDKFNIEFPDELLLMDEPSVALDPKNRRNLINILNRLNQAKIIASHDLNMIMDTCERTILLSDGKIIKDGNTKEILLDKELMEESGLELPLGY